MTESGTRPPRPRLFAEAPDGNRLPVIDVTDPAFAVPSSEPEIAQLREQALREEERRGPLQRLVFSVLLRGLRKRSRLVAALQAARGGYLAGLPTYVMKLGPDNLVPPYDTDIDRRLLAAPAVTSMRIRLHQVSRLLAEGLASHLRAAPFAPLAILDIAGGPSADSLNALVLLTPDGLLDGRTAEIVAYDLDSDGPAFGQRLLAALTTGPLAGRAVRFRHVAGSWDDAAALGAVLDTIPAGAVVAATSEGGLFEYGTDQAIVGALRVLAPRCPVVTGSVTRDDKLDALLRRQSLARTVPRGLDRFARLAEAGGYAIARSLQSPLSDQVLLARSSSGNAASRR